MPKLYDGMTGQKLIEEVNEYSIDSRGKVKLNEDTGEYEIDNTIHQEIDSDLNIGTENGDKRNLKITGNSEIGGSLNIGENVKSKNSETENATVSGTLKKNNTQKYFSYDKDYITEILCSDINTIRKDNAIYSDSYLIDSNFKLDNENIPEGEQRYIIYKNKEYTYYGHIPSGASLKYPNSTDYRKLKMFLDISSKDTNLPSFGNYGPTFYFKINFKVKVNGNIVYSFSSSQYSRLEFDTVSELKSGKSIPIGETIEFQNFNENYDIYIDSLEVRYGANANYGVSSLKDLFLNFIVHEELNYAVRYIS